MPLKDWHLKETWDEAYRVKASRRFGVPMDPPVYIHYCRAVQWPEWRLRAPMISLRLGLSLDSSIVCIGAGFGYLAEALEHLGYVRVAAMDVSNYIQGNKHESEDAELESYITAAGHDARSGVGAQLKAAMIEAGGGPGRRARVMVLNENAATGASRGRIRAAIGLTGNQRFEWALTESVFEGLDDAECIELSQRCHIFASNVAHYIVPKMDDTNQHEGYNWKYMPEWKALLPGDTFIQSGSFDVF